MRKLSVTSMFTLFALSAVLVGNVFAHSALVSSWPAEDEVVAAVPALKLNFNEPVRLLRVSIKDSADQDVAMEFTPQTAAMQQHEVALPALAAGKYTASWTLIGGDSHTMTHTLSFGVDPALVSTSSTSETHNCPMHAAGQPHSESCMMHANHAEHAGHADHADHAAHAGHADHADHAAAATTTPEHDH